MICAKKAMNHIPNFSHQQEHDAPGDIYTRIIEASFIQEKPEVLSATRIDPPLGAMIAIADDDGLYLLEFLDRSGLERDIASLRKKLNAGIFQHENLILSKIRLELSNYFSGKDLLFTTPFHLIGTEFQQKVWQALMTIPLGETLSYLTLAKQVYSPRGFRAVARANATNRFAIIIPCHRVINANGTLGGYGGGVTRKRHLLEHEKKYHRVKCAH